MTITVIGMVGNHVTAAMEGNRAHLTCTECGQDAYFDYVGVPRESVTAGAAWMREHEHEGHGS